MNGDANKTSAHFAAISADNARYAAFAADMVASLDAECASIARWNERTTLFVSETADNNAATVRPAKR